VWTHVAASACVFVSPITAEVLLGVLSRAGIELPALPHTPARLYDCLISAVLEPECVQPTFLVGHPVALSPLAHCYPHAVSDSGALPSRVVRRC
jgi:lysyl-tRNA synthetase class II